MIEKLLYEILSLRVSLTEKITQRRCDIYDLGTKMPQNEEGVSKELLVEFNIARSEFMLLGEISDAIDDAVRKGLGIVDYNQIQYSQQRRESAVSATCEKLCADEASLNKWKEILKT